MAVLKSHFFAGFLGFFVEICVCMWVLRKLQSPGVLSCPHPPDPLSLKPSTCEYAEDKDRPIITFKQLWFSTKKSYTLHVSVSHTDSSTGGNPAICSIFCKMLLEMWSSVRRWFLGSSTAEKNEQNVTNQRQMEGSMQADSGGEQQENGPTPSKKTTVLILVAPPKELQEVWLNRTQTKLIVHGRRHTSFI